MRKIRPHQIILHPVVTEKTLFQMELHNKLDFIVRRDAAKPEIKRAFEELFEVKVDRVNTRITPQGKRATIKLAKEYNAEDIGMRIGIF